MQAICIIAHDGLKQILLLNQLLAPHFEIYVHFDKKMILSDAEKMKVQASGIHTLQVVNVNWGSWSIGEATRLLIKEALKNSDISYIHIISGQDFPVLKIEELYKYYEDNYYIYMRSALAEGIKKSGEPIILWQKYYFNYDRIKRRTNFGKLYHRFSLLKQSLLQVDKIRELNITIDIYHGPVWVDLPRDAAEYLLSTFDHDIPLQKLFKTGFCPDEFWMQTILSNSNFKERIVQDNHRFVKWKKQYNSYPAILDERDYDSIIEKPYHFIRKVKSPISDKLMRKIEENLL